MSSRPSSLRDSIAVRDHLAELPRRVDVKERERAAAPGANAFCASRSMTELSLPIEYIITGFSNSATASRRMWMLSASSARRWVSLPVSMSTAADSSKLRPRATRPAPLLPTQRAFDDRRPSRIALTFTPTIRQMLVK